MSFIKKSQAAQQLNIEIAELDIIASRKGIKRWTKALVREVKEDLEAQGIPQKLAESTPPESEELIDVGDESEPMSPAQLHTEELETETVFPSQPSEDEQTPESTPASGLTKSPSTDLSVLHQHQKDSKEALELTQQGLSEQFTQDAIIQGQQDAVQRVALRIQSARKTETHLLTQLAHSSQLSTQQQLAASQKLFEEKMLSLNGTTEALGKAQLASHQHQKKTQEIQSNLEETIIF